MSRKSRLRHLETELRDVACPDCRAAGVVLTHRAGDADDPLGVEVEPNASYCPTCGRELQVVQVVEFVVQTVEQARRVQALMNQR
jgi:Zn finger protein HypA/HybF involved in hydrogenase expression